MAKQTRQLIPGNECPKSGTYNVVDESGNVAYTVEARKGNRMPPTQGSGYHFELS